MTNPVVHFEINVYNAKRARVFYRKLFGWKIGPLSKVSKDSKWLHANVAKTGKGGIGGGIAGTGSRGVTMYVEVRDVAAALKKAKKLGGKVTRKVMPVPGMGTIGWFRDQAGNEIGLWSVRK